ncbi:MAG: pyruvate kinase [Hyphomicrobiales bacterium]
MKTKIVATIGPATSDFENLKALIKEGVNVCRLNFSHDSHDYKKEIIKNIKKINSELGTNAAILADLQGPKIRTGLIKDGAIELVEGETIIFSTEACEGDKNRIFISYDRFAKDVSIGERVLMDDGKLQVEVSEILSDTEVKMEIIAGGSLSSKKGVNLPDTKITTPSITEKDIEDVIFALEHDVNWVALSFVRTAQDILELKEIIRKNAKHYLPKIIAKIEKPEAIKNIQEIIDVTDAIMIARGDLGVEVPQERVPLIQKNIIRQCQVHSKPVIVATQMMEGMMDNLRPTRAEVSDVAYSVMQGADAVMTSGETSVGKHPLETIATMKAIINEVEQYEDIYFKHFLPSRESENPRFINDSILYSACNLAQHAEAKAIIGNTHSGYSAFRISAQRPKSPIYIFAKNKHLAETMNLVWGVQPFCLDDFHDTDIMLQKLPAYLKGIGLVNAGDPLVFFGSAPLGLMGKTNMLHLSYCL